MGVGCVGVLYATLTGKDAPILDVYSKQLAFAAVVLMGSSVLFGLLAWIADALWAKKAAENFEKTPALLTPDPRGLWHTVKGCCDWVQLVLFLVGFSAAALLTLHHL